MTTTLDLLEECRRLLWDRHDDDYAIDLRGRLEEHIARESAHGESAHIGWRVVTWNSATDREFLTRPEALDYITMNDTDGDWHMEPIMPAAPPSAPLTDDNIKDVLIGTREELAAEVARLRAMLSTAPAVPTGWKLVPVEPTVGMCIAGDSARHNVDDMTRTPAIYRAMLAAAPTPPKGER